MIQADKQLHHVKMFRSQTTSPTIKAMHAGVVRDMLIEQVKREPAPENISAIWYDLQGEAGENVLKLLFRDERDERDIPAVEKITYSVFFYRKGNIGFTHLTPINGGIKTSGEIMQWIMKSFIWGEDGGL